MSGGSRRLTRPVAWLISRPLCDVWWGSNVLVLIHRSIRHGNGPSMRAVLSRAPACTHGVKGLSMHPCRQGPQHAPMASRASACTHGVKGPSMCAGPSICTWRQQPQLAHRAGAKAASTRHAMKCLVPGAVFMQEYMGGGTLKNKVSKQMLSPNSVVYTNKQVLGSAQASSVASADLAVNNNQQSLLEGKGCPRLVSLSEAVSMQDARLSEALLFASACLGASPLVFPMPLCLHFWISCPRTWFYVFTVLQGKPCQ